MSNTLSRLAHWRARHKRLVDLLAYITISVIVAACLLIGILAGVSWNILGKSFLLLLLTAIVFTYFIQRSRRFWDRRAFWWLVSALFTLHCVAWISALRITAIPTGAFRFRLIAIAVIFLEVKLLEFGRNTALHGRTRHYLPE